VGDKRETVREREDLGQPRRKPGLVAHHRRRDAVEPDVERIEVVVALGRTHQIPAGVDDPAV
jgi:hypothetical protein